MLSLSGCTRPAYPISSFVEAPADASCETLAAALRDSGWGRHQYLTLDETWIIHAEPRREPSREHIRSLDRPSAWDLRLRCEGDVERDQHPIPIRNCRSGGRTLAIVEPADLRAIYPELAPGMRCWMTLSWKGVDGRWAHMYLTTEVQPSARSLLFAAPPAEAG